MVYAVKSPISHTAEHYTLVRNLILVILNHVICSCAEIIAGVPNDWYNVCCSLLVTSLGSKSCPQKFYGLSTKAGQTCVKHQWHQGDNCLLVWPATTILTHSVPQQVKQGHLFQALQLHALFLKFANNIGKLLKHTICSSRDQDSVYILHKISFYLSLFIQMPVMYS